MRADGATKSYRVPETELKHSKQHKTRFDFENTYFLICFFYENHNIS